LATGGRFESVVTAMAIFRQLRRLPAAWIFPVGRQTAQNRLWDQFRQIVADMPSG